MRNLNVISVKSVFFCFILSLIPICISSQINFKKGYIITNDGIKIECLIKDFQWEGNPSNIRYKKLDSKDVQKAGTKDIKAFHIYDGVEYASATLDLEIGSHHLTSVTSDTTPRFSKESVFLNVIYKGKVSLYSYGIGKNKRYIISKDGVNFEHLINKPYLNDRQQFSLLPLFREQISKEVKCDEAGKVEAKKLQYNAEELINFIKKYIEC